MEILLDNIGKILEGFQVTLILFAGGTVLALVVGTVLASMRVSPVPPLRLVGATYVNVVRNTPLVLIFIIVVFALPELGIQFSFRLFAILAVGAYTAAFVTEALRSGVNTVQAGQAEAARALGMTFGQTLSHVIMPQAARSVIPPMGSILIALLKNTSVAAGFGVIEATGTLRELGRDFPQALYWLFFGIALGYVVLVLLVSAVFRQLERRLVVVR
ncbi:MAG: amino acid ABC transporter permease [Sporichthyaceae bacterium]|nr:amino acid ABC transporter permease [Sporichthyaceae bacterium]